MKISDQVVYLDADFLICWWSKRKKPELRKRARLLFAKLRGQKYLFVLSPLTFDETWNGIRRELNQPASRGLSHFHPEVFTELEKITTIVLKQSLIKIVQLQNLKEGIEMALNNINQFRLRPRDAFHLAIMKDNEVTAMVTNDQKFTDQQARMNIKVINF